MADYTKIIPLILKVEGGLSNNPHDSASANPCPCPEKWHTNKGITWTTFTSCAAKCGFVATPELFIQMPSYVWNSIFKQMYWDPILGDKINSQALADTTLDWGWASGPHTAVRKLQEFLGVQNDGVMGFMSLKALNDATDTPVKEKALNDKFSAYKLAWYLALPHQEANYAGWTNRLKQIHDFTNSEIK